MALRHLKSRGEFAPKGAFLLLAAAAVALAACGGGGSGSGSGSGSGLHRGGHVEAARATPKAGSVTQSSVGTGATTKSVTTTIELDNSNQITPKVVSDGWGFENQPVEYRETANINTTTWQVMDQSRTYSDGSKRWVRTFTDAPAGSVPDDYLVMGYWLRVPERFVDSDGGLDTGDDLADFVSSIEYGVFVNGGDPYEQANILALTGTATYTGDATAFYIDTVNDKESALRANVTVTADFGTNAELGTVTGTVNGFERYYTREPEPRELDDTELGDLGSVNLGTADIGDSDSGFFTGDTSMTVNGDSMAGKWGGQFYGNGQQPTEAPAAVAGTFGAANSAGDKVIIGTYAGRR